MRFIFVVGAVLLLSACGHVRINYSPDATISTEQAVFTIEQVFLEDYVAKQRPDRVLVGDEYIVLADGFVTTGSSLGSAAPIGSGAIAMGSSKSITREAGARIYYKSVGEVTLHSRRFRENRYAILVRNTEGSVLRRINTTSRQKAQRFVDAMEHMKQLSSASSSIRP